MRRALFLDRDGILNVDYGYIGDPESITLVPGVVEFLHKISDLGCFLVIVTNQSGIARGYFSESDYKLVERRLVEMFADQGVKFDGIYHCPHHPEGLGELASRCDCRKPAPGMIIQAARDLTIDLPRSALIGDKASDIAAAQSAGIKLGFLFDERDQSSTEFFETVYTALRDAWSPSG